MSEIPPGVHWHSDLWASIDGQRFGDAQRMALLVAIAESGSITAASQSLQISYKAAWDAVAAMNAQAGAPLVLRSAGGRNGGGSQLSELGQCLLAHFQRLAAAQRAFLLRHQNHLPVLVTGVHDGEVSLRTAAGQALVAQPAESEAVRPGQLMIARVAADAIVLLAGARQLRISARNRLLGVVTCLRDDGLEIDCGEGLLMRVQVTARSCQELKLLPGSLVTALFKTSSLELDSYSVHAAVACSS